MKPEIVIALCLIFCIIVLASQLSRLERRIDRLEKSRSLSDTEVSLFGPTKNDMEVKQ